MGLSPAELFEMEYREYVWKCEIFQRNQFYDLRKHRSILSFISGKDPRILVPLPGDFDHVPRQKKQEELDEFARLNKLHDYADGSKN